MRTPSSARRSAVLGPIPGTRLVGAVAKRTHASSRPIATKPAGLPRSLQHLATSRDGPTPIEIDDPGRLLDGGDQLAQHAQRLLDAGEVGVRLVDPDLLHAVEPLADQLPDPLRRLPVGREVGRDDDRVRAQPARARGRHRRPDAERARLVAGGRDDRPRAGAGHDHRLADQLRAPQQLDRRVERVAVEVGDDALWPGRHANKRTPAIGPSARGEDRPVAAEAQPLGGRLGEVELAAADVRAAVDHAHADRPHAVAQRQPAAARQRLVGDADRGPATACRRSRACCRRGPGRTTRRWPTGRRSCGRSSVRRRSRARARARSAAAGGGRAARTRRRPTCGRGRSCATSRARRICSDATTPAVRGWTAPATDTRWPARMCMRFFFTPTAATLASACTGAISGTARLTAPAITAARDMGRGRMGPPGLAWMPAGCELRGSLGARERGPARGRIVRSAARHGRTSGAD